MATDVNAEIRWDTLTHHAGDTLRAKIITSDPSGRPFTAVRWVLFKNGVQTASGSGLTVVYENADVGVYRMSVEATDGTVLVESSSTVFVDTGFEIQSSVEFPQPQETLQLMGEVFSHQVNVQPHTPFSLPSAEASIYHEIFLLPGSTHFRVELEGAVAGDVVVRTDVGNWTLVGPPFGLNDEDLGFNYTHGRPYTPAPVDLRLRVSVDAYNVRDVTTLASSFRIKFRCYRTTGSKVYRYRKCPYSLFFGGSGQRQRRFAAVFTALEVELDVESGQNRLGSTAIENFTTPDVNVIPARLALSGAPDPVVSSTGFFFTGANILSVYEPVTEGLGELDAKAAYGIEGNRAFYLTLNQPGNPPLIQRIRRLSGKMVCLVSGAVAAGSVIRAEIVTGKLWDRPDGSRGHSRTVEVPIPLSVYNPSVDHFVKVAETDIDLEDFGFAQDGVLVYFNIEDFTFSVSNNIDNYLPFGRQATGYVQVNSIPANGDKITLTTPFGARDYTFSPSGITIQTSSINLQAQAIAQAINGDPTGSNVTHHETSAHPDVYAFAIGPRVVLISRRPGTWGNLITLSTTSAGITVSAGFTGGINYAGMTKTLPGNQVIGMPDLTLTVAGSRYQFPAQAINRNVDLTALPTNSGKCFVGDVNVTNSAGTSRQNVLVPGATKKFFVDDTSRLHAMGDVGGDVITIFIENDQE